MSEKYIQDMTNRYIYQVIKRLPAADKKEIDNELRVLIADMLEERTNGRLPEDKDIADILTELGNPRELAAKYMDDNQVLIGKELYPTYCTVLKIVIPTVLGGMLIASSLVYILHAQTPAWDIGANWLSEMISAITHIFANWLTEIFTAVITAFAWVTIAFAIVQRKGIHRDNINQWSVSTLPSVPKQEVTIRRSEPAFGLVITVLLMILFAGAPQLLGVYAIGVPSTAESSVTMIPIFDELAIRSALPLLLICLALGMVRDFMKLIEGSYTKRLAITTVITDGIGIVLTIIIFTGFDIWNKDFVQEIMQAFGADVGEPVTMIWSYLPMLFIGIFVFSFIIDIANTLYKSYKATKAMV